MRLSNLEPLGMWFHGMDFYELLNHMTLMNSQISASEFYATLYDHMNELQYVLDQKELSDRIICVGRAV